MINTRATCLLISVTIVAFTILSANPNLRRIYWMSEEYPPYNYSESGHPKGLCVDIVLEIFRRHGIKGNFIEIDFLPWTRSYRILQHTPDTALFSMTVSQERRKLFKFVEPIGINKVMIIKRKDSPLTISSSDDLAYLTYGAIRDDIGDQVLQAKGVTKRQIEYSNKAISMIYKLRAGRLDAIAYSWAVTKWHARKAGMYPSDFEAIFELKKDPMGIAFHKDTDDELISILQKTLDEMTEEGFYKKISSKYF